MGLLDIWSDWKRNNQSQSDGFEDYTPTNGGTLDTAGGMKGSGINATMNRKSESPLVQNPIFTKDNFKKVGNKIYDALPGSDLDRKFATKEAEKIQGTPKGEMPIPSDPITTGGEGVKLAEDQGFLSKLSGIAGVDMKQASANWKDKGGFEGLMSNPAFSLGLALMQSSANGKTINQGILNNFVKAGGISAEYKDRIEARKQEPIQATAGDISETKDLLKQMNIEEGNWFENILSKATGGNPGLEWDTAVEEISIQYQMKIRDEQERLKEAGKSQVIRKTDKIRIMRQLIKEGKIKESGGIPFLTSSTLSMPIPKAEGGPIQEGKSYLVGEKGPEIIIPSSDGNVLTNDDSQIFNMLLASNPQLQKVSKQRAERILKARFPQYFEG